VKIDLVSRMSKSDLREFGAAPIVLAVLGYGGLLLAAALAGLAAWLLLGLATVGAALIVVWAYARRHRHPAIEAAPPAHGPAAPDSGLYRVLVVADEPGPRGLREQLLGHAHGRRTEAFVVAPALGSRLARWTGDERAYSEATGRLEATVRALEGAGVSAAGHIGSHDPIQAADDGLREFPADEVFFVTGSEGDANWLEEGVVESARARYGVPVTHIVAGLHD